MDFIIDYWYIVIAVLAICIAIGFTIYKFAGLPTKEQAIKIKEWLLWAVIKAETELGGGTGKIKLRYVYDLFILRFPIAARLVSFELFSLWVDEALDEMKDILSKNEAVKNLIEGGK